jgi:hypothetical protein
MIALMMEAARTSETSFIQLRTRQYIPEDSELHVNTCIKIIRQIPILLTSEAKPME